MKVRHSRERVFPYSESRAFPMGRETEHRYYSFVSNSYSGTQNLSFLHQYHGQYHQMQNPSSRH